MALKSGNLAGVSLIEQKFAHLSPPPDGLVIA